MTKNNKNLIDTTKTWIPDGFTLDFNQNYGLLDINDIDLYLSEKQKTGVIKGEDLLIELKEKQPLNSAVLRYFLDNQDKIPVLWNGRYIYFWGTIFRGPDGNRRVLHIYRFESEWGWNCSWLDRDWHAGHPSAVRASNNLLTKAETFDPSKLRLSWGGKNYKIVEE